MKIIKHLSGYPRGWGTPTPVAGVLLALACCCVPAVFADTDGTLLMRVLRERGIPFNSNRVARAMLEGGVRAVDPGAALLGPGDPAPSAGVASVTSAEEWAHGICYLKVAGLNADATQSVCSVIAAWATNGSSGLIMDLRLAGGDSLAAVDRVAAMIVDVETPLYSVKDGSGTVLETHQSGHDAASPMVKVPVMVLIDEGTSGASETLAAVLRGRHGALLVGRTSSGHNGIREIVPLSESNSAYIATRWVVPRNGGARWDQGVQPDITVSNDAPRTVVNEPRPTGISKPLSDRAKMDRELMHRVADDPVLARATDILLGLKALAGSRERPLPEQEPPSEDGPAAREAVTPPSDGEAPE